MKNLQHIDYNAVLSDLKSKRLELDKAITHLDNLMSLGILHYYDDALISNAGGAGSKKSEVANLGVYDGAIHLLKAKGSKMTTDEIVTAILASGKKFDSANPRVSISTTLYKPKKDSNLIKVGESEWGLTDWEVPDSNESLQLL